MLTGARGYTMDRQSATFSALVIDGDRIVAVGEEAELKLQFGSRLDKVLDVEGRTVLPGFVDSHVHLSWLGIQMNALNLSDAKNGAQVLERVRAYANKLPNNAWIIGANWDENLFDDHAMASGMPTMVELDQAGGGRPVVLRRICGHVLLANRAAYQAAGLGDRPTDPSGGHFGRDADGNLDGFAYEGATAMMEQSLPKPTSSEVRASVERAMRTALSSGITAVHSEDVRFIDGLYQTMELYSAAQRDGIRLRVHQLVGYDYLDEYADFLSELSGSANAVDSSWLETGAVKLFSDGSLGGRTAFLLHPYTDKPDMRGLPIYSQRALNACVRRVRKLGLPVAIHAIGDGGVDRVLGALEENGRADNGRDRLIHAEVVNHHLISRMQQLGSSLAVDVQPRFAASDLSWATERLGSSRVAHLCAWKTMLDAGLHLCGGSDAPVEPIAPLLGIHAAMTRRLPGAVGVTDRFATDESGNNVVAENRRLQALDVQTSIRLFTRGATYAIGREHEKGVIRPGWLADLVVLDSDIVQATTPDEILRTNVVQTIVGGETAFTLTS